MRAMQQGRPRSEGRKCERVKALWGRGARGVQECGPGRASAGHDTSNCLVFTDYSSAFNNASKTVVPQEVANCVPALTSFVAKGPVRDQVKCYSR